MFISILSHFKIRGKGIYYRGWDEKIYRQQNQLDMAYTPEIDMYPEQGRAQDSSSFRICD
jgi:hypothetical protein